MTDATRHRLTDERPRFVLAHIFAPHAPIVWDRAGQPLPPPECFPECSIYSMPTTTGLAGQISYVGDLVLEALDAMMVRSPDATIALMSDHGMHGPDDPESNLFKTLFAIRSPPGPAYVPDDIQPTEILRAIAGATFGHREPWRGWVSAAEQPLTLTRYGGPPP